jgi:GPH family glycoside/pentoside/hexuronide:cation symporter
MVASIAGIPFWSAMGARYERHRVWAVSLITGGIACAGFALLSPGPLALPLALPLAFMLYPVVLFTLIGLVIVYAMQADIVDYGRLISGQDHAGLYGSIFSFLQKSVLGVSSAAGLALVGIFGFDVTAATQSASGILGLKLVCAGLPALGLFAGTAIIWNYPLTRARILQIQEQLNLHKDAASNEAQ